MSMRWLDWHSVQYTGPQSLWDAPVARQTARIAGSLRVKQLGQDPAQLEADWVAVRDKCVETLKHVYPGMVVTLEEPCVVFIDSRVYGSIDPIVYFCELVVDTGWQCVVFFDSSLEK